MILVLAISYASVERALEAYGSCGVCIILQHAFLHDRNKLSNEL